MGDVGSRLKILRKIHKLSQRELAKRAGVPNSTISSIEKGSVSPSVSSLKKLLDAIPISLAEFFAMESEDPQPEVVFPAAAMVDVGTGGVQRLIMNQSNRETKILLIDETFPQGADTGDKLSHEGEETGIIISGEIELTLGDCVYHLKAGDGYQFESTTPHKFRNVGDEPCRLICCTTPAKF